MPQMEGNKAVEVGPCESVYDIWVMAKHTMPLGAGIYTTDENCIGIHTVQ